VNTIPPIDLARQHQVISQEIEARVLEVLRSGRYVGGTAVTDFENQFANYIDTQFCVGCNSGTDALYLALRALGIGEGDEVITTPFTFIATSEVIVRVGAKPVFVDIAPQTFNFDLEQIPKSITSKTKAIIAVHLFGQPIDMTRLTAIAKEHGLFVIEDCAQATGASWQEQKVGSIGDIGCFSFFPTKNLGAYGDGGCITTNNQAIADQIKLLREHGLVREVTDKVTYRHEISGLNSRLDSLQAAILSIKLSYLDQNNKQRQQLAHNYQQLLGSFPQLKLPQAIAGGLSVWNQYTILIPNHAEANKVARDFIQSELKQQGIITMVYYPLPLHLQPVYRYLNYQPGILTQAEKVTQEVLSLPMFPGLTSSEQQQIADGLKACL